MLRHARRLPLARPAAARRALSDDAAGGRIPGALGRIARDMVVDRGEGCWLHTTDGRRLLDLTSGIGVTNLGHCQPAVTEAIARQASRLVHGQLGCVNAHTPMLELVDRLRGLTAPFGLDQFAFSNSGAEAVETAVRVARQATGRSTVAVFRGGFHGRTLGAASLTTAKTCYRSGIQPLMAGVAVSEFPYPHRSPAEDCAGHALEQFELLLKQQVDPDDLAAILFEPVLGEGGYVVPPTAFFEGLREVANRTGALLVADEVQTGFGRTGTTFYMEQTGVRPDVLVMAKGIANGMPLSAVATTADVMGRMKPGSLGGTYGGNAVACAAANATIGEMDRLGVLENVRARGEQMRAGLEAMRTKHGADVVADIRGAGLMLAVEFGDAVPRGTAAAASQAAYRNEDMLVLTAGVYETLRLIPPLVISEAEADDAVARLDRAVAAALQ